MSRGDRPTYPKRGDVVRLREKGINFVVEEVRDDPRFTGFKIVTVACMHRHERVRRRRLTVGSWRQLEIVGAP